ncbi:MAG: sigma-54 dependent transcriptional regulator [Myxococcota bacterium]|nr:sigma-54 dependent transcriptional regulator [Myxococcota bacterium]
MSRKKRENNPSNEKELILAVDDSEDALEIVRRNLTAHGYRVATASSVPKATRIISENQVDLVITDLKMPKISGMDLIRHIRENYRDTEVMMITGYATIEGAVTAMKTGAEEYLAKPFTDEELFQAVKRALDKRLMRQVAMSKGVVTPKTPHGFVGDSQVMVQVYHAIAKASRSMANTLITGESGTGKELVARAIHYSGKRNTQPFVTVNCGGIPETLLESELFGYVKGAFTGATGTRAGFFQTAEGGTIFLDEVGEMSLAMQVKLLRALQGKEICMVGSARPQKVNVRVVAATNKDLSLLASQGMFRDDLYYRLNVIAIELPPLRDRDRDILDLVNFFVHEYTAEAGLPALKFSDRALESLKNYHWPGNVRELQNVIHRLVVMGDGDYIDVPDLPILMRGQHMRKTGFNRTLAEVEAEHVANVLASVDGNKTRAAQILGIDRKTLRSKLSRTLGLAQK